MVLLIYYNVLRTMPSDLNSFMFSNPQNQTAFTSTWQVFRCSLTWLLYFCWSPHHHHLSPFPTSFNQQCWRSQRLRITRPHIRPSYIPVKRANVEKKLCHRKSLKRLGPRFMVKLLHESHRNIAPTNPPILNGPQIMQQPCTNYIVIIKQFQWKTSNGDAHL